MALAFTLHGAPAADAPRHACDCLVIGVFADQSLTPAGQAVDAASGGRLAALVARGDVSGKTGKTALLHDLPGVAADVYKRQTARRSRCSISPPP